MEKVNKYILTAFAIISSGFIAAQEISDTVSDANTGVIDDVSADSIATSTAEVKSPPYKRTKIDGISAVIGDYVILESDVEKALIDLKTQGVSMADVTRCGLLGKLMEDRLYAHQAVQDSLLVSDDEIAAQSDRQLQGLVQQVGSMEKVLKFYRKEDEASLRQEIQKINKLQMLSGKMQQSIVEGIEITPEEVRQFFNKIPESERPVFGAEMEISQIIKQPKATAEEKQHTIDRLNAIKEDIEDNDASFNVKAILYSEGPSKSNGGLLGVITKDSGYDKDFKDVVFGLREGEISEPFETQFGYHIAFVEKIRGQERDVRHIIMQPEISQESMDKAKRELDTIRKHINEGKYTFAAAARNFSDEKETKFDGGLLRNPQDFSSRFELTKMDPALYNQVRNLKDNEVSYPILEEDPRGGASKYKLLQVTNRYDEHTADFSKDYMKIQQLAKTEKQYEAIKKWMDEHIEDTYISVNGSSRDCEFENNWLKAE
ncbi:peptidylprolyl isomerase [Aurantibacter sp.]|uniref:peptidylprolyl isomerase n=1 Tax=Aurantibacter sp. TaxID=2807103 RepID=UPI0032663D0A